MAGLDEVMKYVEEKYGDENNICSFLSWIENVPEDEWRNAVDRSIANSKKKELRAEDVKRRRVEEKKNRKEIDDFIRIRGYDINYFDLFGYKISIACRSSNLVNKFSGYFTVCSKNDVFSKVEAKKILAKRISVADYAHSFDGSFRAGISLRRRNIFVKKKLVELIESGTIGVPYDLVVLTRQCKWVIRNDKSIYDVCL